MRSRPASLGERAARAYRGPSRQIDPDNLPVRLELGKVYARRKDYERAREAWEAVLALDPENSEASTLIRKLVRGEF